MTVERIFHGYSYRTNSRFGGRVQLAIEGRTVWVSGPRVSRTVYGFWYAVQFILLWLVLLALLSALLLSDWRFVVGAVVLFVAQFAFSSLGVAAFWELTSLTNVFEGQDQVASFSRAAVREVRVGRGWARGGVRWIIPYAIPGIDQLSAGRAVSFEATDGDSGRHCVYAVLLWNEADATALAELLKS